MGCVHVSYFYQFGEFSDLENHYETKFIQDLKEKQKVFFQLLNTSFQDRMYLVTILKHTKLPLKTGSRKGCVIFDLIPS